ncbi:MAG: MBL fold metallo-hydrolase [Planctomycetota bacterium]|jgi:glyoxylase-like metal-dependent hydrolase (beta-lactamase superfamily II)
MKKDTGLLLLLAIVLFAPDCFGRRGQTQPLEFKKMSDRLYEIVGGRGSRGGVYIGDNGVLVIDAKSDKKTVDQVIEGIGKITDKPVKYLVNTHSDGDHVTGNRYFPQTVTFIAHENCRRDFFLPGRNGAASDWNKPELLPFVPSVTFRDKMDIYLGTEKVELWYFGVGHTTGDAVLYFPQEKTAFVGDQIFLERPQLIHSHKNGNSFEHVKTLTRMLDTIAAERFCSGHSEMTDRSGIRKHIAQMKKRQEKIRALIADRKSTEEIKAEFAGSEARLIETICNELKR